MRAAEVPLFGGKLALGELALEVWPLPRMPIAFTLWKGEEDLPPGGTLLLNQSTTN